MSDEFRVEKDSLGEVHVPTGVLYGPQTQRAVENFPISGQRFSRPFIKALGLVKKTAALANKELGLLDSSVAEAIATAAQEVVEGRWDGEFVLDIYQTGSGTSTNMNANEVLARRAGEILGDGSHVHPNDQVNLGQSSNDVFPTAMYVAARDLLVSDLLPALGALQLAMEEKAHAFDDVLKSGRTHLMDATPVRLGQEFGGWARQVELSVRRVRQASDELDEKAFFF
jgi:fumarate hydratase class II